MKQAGSRDWWALETETRAEAVALATRVTSDPIVGTPGDDVLRGTTGDDLMDGGKGDDKLIGGRGDEVLTGGPGADQIHGSVGYDTVNYAGNQAGVTIDYTQPEGRDVVVYIDDVATDRLRSIENVIGGSGDDWINRADLPGTASSSFINGGAGDDVLAGSIHVDGGDGDDTVFAVAYDRSRVPTLVGGAGEHDVLTLEALRDTLGPYPTIDLTKGYYYFTYASEAVVFSGFEDAIGTGGDDRIIGDANANVLHGGVGTDWLTGEGAATGVDMLYGDDGGDLLGLGNGSGIAFGGVGDDYLAVLETVASGSVLEFHGGDGIDELFVQNESGAVIDTRTGTIQLANGATATFDGIENLSGGWGDDVVIGDATVVLIRGEIGDDVLTGGAGTHTFMPGYNGRTIGVDRITDFDSAEHDLIDLSDVDAKPATPGIAHFRFIGEREFSGEVRQLRVEVVDGNTFLLGDTDGDRNADYRVQLDGVHAIHKADLILA